MSITTYEFVAPATGKCVPIEAVHSIALSSKALGEGVSIFPTDGTVVAPCDCVVCCVAPERYAVTLLDSSRNVELMLCADIDENMPAPQFHFHVKAGQQLHAGDVLFTCDIDAIQSHGAHVEFPCIITNAAAVDVNIAPGDVVRGETHIMSCEYLD